MESILKSNKKGSMQELYGSVQVLILVAFMVGVGLLVITQLQTSTFKSTTPTIVNESGFINSTGYTLTYATDRGFSNPVIVSAINATDGGVIPSANYTVSSAGVVTNATVTEYNTANITYTYTFNNDTSASTALGNASSAIGGIASTWLVVLVSVIMAGLVIMILVRAFSGQKK